MRHFKSLLNVEKWSNYQRFVGRTSEYSSIWESKLEKCLRRMCGASRSQKLFSPALDTRQSYSFYYLKNLFYLRLKFLYSLVIFSLSTITINILKFRHLPIDDNEQI